MAEELTELKSVLRSLVVSSPTQMDLKTLMRDYRNMVGAHLPLAKYGYKSALDFLRERFSDCFVITGPPSNPVLTLIVPDALKHIDKFVQKQKIASTSKCKSKRRSIPEFIKNPISQDFTVRKLKPVPPIVEQKPVPPIVEQKPVPPIVEQTPMPCVAQPKFVAHNARQTPVAHIARQKTSTIPEPEKPMKPQIKAADINNDIKENINDCQSPAVTSDDVKNFLRKRLPYYNSMYTFEDTQSQSQDDDSGKHTSSSTSSAKALQFEELKTEVVELVTASPNGIWCTDLIKSYRDRYKRELNFVRFGYTSVSGLAAALEQRLHIAQPTDCDDWLLLPPGRAPPAPPAPRAPLRAPLRPRAPPPAPRTQPTPKMLCRA
ncbi:unnamed protein product [Chrysodeixis includens]|uniref:HTH OST-type domain-containing protein n=1 Tax=Chrysodeixis includens TaxID=689277 RepID=A0A9N8KUH1_CHRIL|nr:unnamed protein product [Chrysodeixis includens]